MSIPTAPKLELIEATEVGENMATGMLVDGVSVVMTTPVMVYST